MPYDIFPINTFDQHIQNLHFRISSLLYRINCIIALVISEGNIKCTLFSGYIKLYHIFHAKRIRAWFCVGKVLRRNKAPNSATRLNDIILLIFISKIFISKYLNYLYQKVHLPIYLLNISKFLLFFYFTFI